MDKFTIMTIGFVHNNTIISNGCNTVDNSYAIRSVNDVCDLRDFIYRNCGIVMINADNFGILPPNKVEPPYQSIQSSLKECISYINHFYFKRGECIQ